MPPRRSANPVSMLNMQLTLKWSSLSASAECKWSLAFRPCILSDSLLNNSEVNSEGMCWVCVSYPTVVSPGTLVEATMQTLPGGRTERHERDGTQVCWPANGMEREGEMPQAPPKHTHTHQPAALLSTFPGSFVQQHCRGLPWVSLQWMRSKNTRQETRYNMLAWVPLAI